MRRRREAVISNRTGRPYSVTFESGGGRCYAYVDAIGVTFEGETFGEASEKARAGVEAYELRGGGARIQA